MGIKKIGRAAVLDLDGILLDGMGYHIQAWREAFTPLGLVIDSRNLYLLEGIKTVDVIDIICKEYGINLSKEERRKIAEAKKKAYREIFQPTPMKGAKEFLNTLVECGYSLAIATGTLASSAQATLRELGMLDQIDVIVSADLDIPGKPDPAPFRAAVKSLGTLAENTLGVDNAPAGVASAVRAGLPCAGVASYLPKTDLSEAHAVFSDIPQLTAWLQEDYRRSRGSGPWRLGLDHV